jgi:hypothetical protein
MKKLLIIFLLSFAFLGSANANSIDGAFGYKLGQVVEDVKENHRFIGIKADFSLSKTFVPKKPLPGNFSYKLETTLKDKKVFRISAGSSPDDCSTERGSYFKIMKIYELRYGKFVKTTSKKQVFMGGLRVTRSSLLSSYTEGNREILIECSWLNGSDLLRYLYIYYTDSKLEKIKNEEAENNFKIELKEIEQQFIDDASEYDI